jgi:murein DD-endopeptidase MepM/ murein hydrolase activator NlpD
MRRFWRYLFLAWLMVPGMAGCTQLNASQPLSLPLSPSPPAQIVAGRSATALPALPTRTPEASPTATFAPATPTPSQTPLSNPLGLVGCKKGLKQNENYAPKSPPEVCVYAYSFPFIRPIEAPGNSKIETSYRFESTQNGKRSPHHGVDMGNKAGVPVLAAAAGKVIVAGDDLKVSYATQTDFYGRLVILEHDLPAFDQPVYTLYGHLSKVSVKVGQKVKSGTKIGEVGLGGIAAGTHLHFEVRFGENSYNSTRNPELWLAPLLEENSESGGVLAGRFLDKQGNEIANDDISLQRVDPAGQPVGSMIYLATYAEPATLGQPPWQESFAASSLTPGLYRVVFIENRPIAYTVEVMPGRITFLTFVLD